MKKNIGYLDPFRFASKAWDLRFERHVQPYISICESEARAMAGLAARWGSVETGGEVYGLMSHAGRPVIMLVTPPGPNSTHGVAEFTQDLDFLRKTNVLLKDYFGLQFLGTHHSHHTLNIKGLSRGDIRSTHSIAQKNGYRRLCQFVLTFGKKPAPAFNRDNDRFLSEERIKRSGEAGGQVGDLTDLYTRVKGCLVPCHQINIIRIHSFLYLDAARGEPVQCPIRIIRGTSPFRRALLRNSIIPELAKPYSFPLSRILFDSFKLQDEPAKHELEMPAWISKQCLQLPENVMEKTRVVCKEGLVVLSLPLTKGTVFVVYRGNSPRVEAVYFSGNRKDDSPIELSKEVLCISHYAELTTILEKVVRFVEVDGSFRRSDKPMGIRERVEAEEETSNT
jgi:hypothetical protein